MSQYHRQVDLVLPNLDLTRIQGGDLFQGYGALFRAWEILDLDYLESYTQSHILFHIPPIKTTYVEIQGTGATPHSERAAPVTVVLNYYIETGRDITQFWHTRKPQAQGDHIPVLGPQGWQSSPVENYSISDLEFHSAFTAQAHTAWLLDVGCIHSVVKSRTSTVRKFLRWGWHGLTVDQVYRSIEILA